MSRDANTVAEGDYQRELSRQEDAGGHTPGPWEWSGTNDLYGGTPVDSVIYCTAEYDDGYYGELHCESVDRCLIAAAPDLLEACRELINNLQRDSGHLGSPHVEHALALGRAAIAKARGEA